MPPIDPNTSLTIAWGLAVLLLAWTWLPALIASLGGTTYRNSGADDIHELRPDRLGDDYLYWHEQALELGYEPVGSLRTLVRFDGPEWQVQMPARAFYSKGKQVYFIIQKLAPPTNVWFGAMFATPFSDGGLILTANADAPPPDFEAAFISQGRSFDTLSELEVPHLAALEVCRKQGRQAETDGSIDTLLQSIDANNGPRVKRLGGRRGWDFLLLHGIIHACGSMPAVVAFGFEHYGVPITNIGLWLLMAISNYAERHNRAQMVWIVMYRMFVRRQEKKDGLRLVK